MSLIGNICYDRVCEYCKERIESLKAHSVGPIEEGKIIAYRDVIHKFGGEG